MKKDKLQRRQYKYKVGSVVEFTDRFLESYSNWRRIKKGDIGVVTRLPDESDSWRKYEVMIDIYRDGEIYEKDTWVYKGRWVHLLSYNDALIERL